MELNGAKGVAMTFLGLGSIVLGLIPRILAARNYRLGNNEQSKLHAITSALLCLGAGVLLATAFTHILPEVSGGERLRSEVTSQTSPHTSSLYYVRATLFQVEESFLDLPEYEGIPMAEIIFFAGFFFCYLLEELVLSIASTTHQPTRQRR